jgi:pimeloyl-ACP methyl ester carboxylesterase
MSDAEWMDEYRRGGLVFDVIDEGSADGPVVVLLHGFPQLNTTWSGVIKRLSAQGYRCLAPNQRGYSRGARPARVKDYRVPELVGDVAALIDASGARRVHLVGFDWGARLAWAVAAEIPERLVSLVAVSVPHPAALLRALVTSRQAFASWYVYFCQLPRIPERYFLDDNGDAPRLSRFMQRLDQPPDAAYRDARAMSEPGLLTAALNWYRANSLSLFREARTRITVPTMYIWSNGDAGLLYAGARNCGRYVNGEYRFETLSGSHWMLDEQPDAVADLLSDWLAAHPL